MMNPTNMPSAKPRDHAAASPAAPRILRARGGFTLVETLLALLILVIFTGLVAMGIPAANRAYTNAVTGSNAQVLLSTAAIELRDELGMAQDANRINGTVYYLSGEGYWACLEPSESGDGIVKHVYYGNAPAENRAPGEGEEMGSPIPLITPVAQTDAVRVKFDSIDFDPGSATFTVHGLRVEPASGSGAALAQISQTQSGANPSGDYVIKAIMLEEGR